MTMSFGYKMRRIGAVVAGLLFIVIASTAVDGILHATNVFPPLGDPMSDGLLALATAYRIVISVAGCWLTARLAPDKPMQHAIALGFIGVVLSTAGLIATWNGGPAFGAKWYPITLIAVSLPCAWAGGWLFERPLRARA